MKEVRPVVAVVPECQSTSVLSANILPEYTTTHFTATSVEYAGRWFLHFNVLPFLPVCLFACLFVCLLHQGLCTKNLHVLLRLSDSEKWTK